MWNERYAQPGFAYGTEPNEFLVEHAAALQSPVLSLAEGEGRNAVWLAAKGLAVTAVDASDVGLAKARALAVEHGIALGTGAPGGSLVTVVADLAEYAVVESAWGSIVSIWCHVPPLVRRRLHAACVRGLVPGGVLLLEAYTPDQIARVAASCSASTISSALPLFATRLTIERETLSSGLWIASRSRFRAAATSRAFALPSRTITKPRSAPTSSIA